MLLYTVRRQQRAKSSNVACTKIKQWSSRSKSVGQHESNNATTSQSVPQQQRHRNSATSTPNHARSNAAAKTSSPTTLRQQRHLYIETAPSPTTPTTLGQQLAASIVSQSPRFACVSTAALTVHLRPRSAYVSTAAPQPYSANVP